MSDDNKLYRLVFTGNLLPGHSKNKVVARLQQMLHLDKKKASRLVAGRHKQINKKLTLDRAERLRLLILKQGAECVLLPIEESFVSTQQLPMFIRNEENGVPQSSKSDTARSTAAHSATSSVDSKESISRIRKRSMPVSRNTKIKYLFYVIFLMSVEAVIIWNYKPTPPAYECSNVQGNNAIEDDKSSPVLKQKGSVKRRSPVAIETTEKLRNISVRASLWFADRGSDTSPADVSWIWIQGDIGISVREMNDSWGNPIRYFGKIDRFELRSSGADNIFYTDDDIFREVIL